MPVHPDEERAWHRHFAVTTYNHAWELLEQPGRTEADNARMLAAAFTSRYHWSFIGDDRNFAIGDWQIAHVACHCGLPKTALKYAKSALETVQRHGWKDWLLASVFEGMARAHAISGNKAERDAWLAKAQDECDRIEEEDERRIIQEQIRTVPDCS